MYDGGLFRGHKFRAENDSDTAIYSFAVVWGQLIADPEVKMYNKKKTTFTVKYHNKNYLNIVMWGDSPAANIASTLEKGDMIVCFGTITEKEYLVQKGEHRGEKKIWTDLNAQIVIPMSALEFTLSMFGNDGIAKLMQESEAAIKSDVMESSGDYDDYEDVSIPDDCPF